MAWLSGRTVEVTKYFGNQEAKVFIIFVTFQGRSGTIVVDLEHLSKFSIVCIGILGQVTAKESKMTPVDAIAHPKNCDGSLLFPLYHHLNLAQGHNNVH